MNGHITTMKVVLIAVGTAVLGAATALTTDENVSIALIHEVPATITALAALISAIVGIVVLLRVGEVHQLTNRNFSEQKQEIADLRAQLTEGQIKLGAEKKKSQDAEMTRITLAAETKATDKS